MRTPDSRFYCKEIVEGNISLDENESAHAVKVCRATVGDILQLTDGCGHLADAKITEASPRACKATVLSIEKVERRSPKLELAIGCLKDDALEEVVFHAAQMEIDAIHFLRTDYSQERKDSDLGKLIRRAELKSLVSLKQSKKAWMTKIEGPISFESWISSYRGDLILCDIDGEKTIHTLNNDTALLVGPEGGFSASEIEKIRNFRNGDVRLMNLGNTRLRARTAAIVALGRLI